jgi:hypothetical protein
VQKHEFRTKPAFEPVAFTYDVAVKLQPGGPVESYEPVMPADLIDVYSETWLESHLRKGRPDLRFEDLCMRLLPVLAEGSDSRCAGLIVESRKPDGRTDYHRISIQTLSPIAERGVGQLIKNGVLKAGQPYFYEVIAKRSLDTTLEMVCVDHASSEKTRLKHTPLSYREVPLPSLLKEAEAVGAVDGWTPIFYTRNTFIKADQFARVGAAKRPPVETGAVILGLLCTCPDTGEFFVAAFDAIELADTQQSGFSLTYTDKTWAHIQAGLKARQANPATRGARIVGQCHGHNFLPQTETHQCESCAKRKTCGLTSVFISEPDLLWSRCIFSRQPWAFCHIFGFDVCGSPVQGLFGFRQARLVERGFYLIDDFSMDAVLTEEKR